MQGPARLVRSNEIANYKHLGPLHEWIEGKAYLLVDHVEYRGKQGAVFTYNNPPVHQMGNPALAAYLAGFDALVPLQEELWFLLFYTGCDPVHAGGDLKESLGRLEESNAERNRLQAAGAGREEIDALFGWSDARIDRGFALYKAFRTWSEKLRTVAICGGGTRFGGSAEVPLMADEIVADSRSALCFSESQIGLIPGWGGVGRAITKAGLDNARTMAATCPIVRAHDLDRIGIYNEVVLIDWPLPRQERTDDPEADRARYVAALQKNNDEAGKLLLEAALASASDMAGATYTEPAKRRKLADPEQVAAEIARRSNPDSYRDLWGRSLQDARQALKELGKPLAPQSIEKLEALLGTVDPAAWDEEAFIRAEGKADGELYRDPRFIKGILATLQQTVADFRKVD